MLKGNRPHNLKEMQSMCHSQTSGRGSMDPDNISFKEPSLFSFLFLSPTGAFPCCFFSITSTLNRAKQESLPVLVNLASLGLPPTSFPRVVAKTQVYKDPPLRIKAEGGVGQGDRGVKLESFWASRRGRSLGKACSHLGFLHRSWLFPPKPGLQLRCF